MFIVSEPTSGYGLSGIWGQYGGRDTTGIRMESSTSWPNGAPPANVNDFTGTSGGTSGSMALNGGLLQTGSIAFTLGVPQVLEAIGNTTENRTGIFDVGTLDTYDNRAYTGLIGEVVAYSGTLTTAQQAAVNAYLGASWGVSTPGGTNFLPTATSVNLSGSGASLNLGNVTQTIADLSGVAGSSVVSPPAPTRHSPPAATTLRLFLPATSAAAAV